MKRLNLYEFLSSCTKEEKDYIYKYSEEASIEDYKKQLRIKRASDAIEERERAIDKLIDLYDIDEDVDCSSPFVRRIIYSNAGYIQKYGLSKDVIDKVMKSIDKIEAMSQYNKLHDGDIIEAGEYKEARAEVRDGQRLHYCQTTYGAPFVHFGTDDYATSISGGSFIQFKLDDIKFKHQIKAEFKIWADEPKENGSITFKAYVNCWELTE